MSFHFSRFPSLPLSISDLHVQVFNFQFSKFRFHFLRFTFSGWLLRFIIHILDSIFLLSNNCIFHDALCSIWGFKIPAVAMETYKEICKVLPTSWASADVEAGRNPWPLLQRVQLDRLGPLACFRLKVLWMTHHFEPFYITEAPMIAKLWRLERMTSDGMLLERAAKDADSTWDKLVVRPNEAAIVVNVVVHQAYNTLPMEIQCYFMSGRLAWEGVKPADFTWFGLALQLYLTNNDWWNVSFVSSMEKVPRSCYKNPISLPVSTMEEELQEMEVKQLAVTGFFWIGAGSQGPLEKRRWKAKGRNGKDGKEGAAGHQEKSGQEIFEKDQQIVRQTSRILIG